MKNLFLVISCLFLTILFHVEEQERTANVDIQAAEVINTDVDQDDYVLYDDDVITLLTTYDCQNDDVVPCRMNQWGRHIRVLISRIQHQNHRTVLIVKRLTHLLSVYLSTLVHHNSQFYSTFKSICWQFPSDCYVYAIRQIII